MTGTPLPPSTYVIYRVNWSIDKGDIGSNEEFPISSPDSGDEEPVDEFPDEGYFEDITFDQDDIDFEKDGSFIKKVEGFRINATIQGGRPSAPDGGDGGTGGDGGDGGGTPGSGNGEGDGGSQYTWETITTELISLEITSSHESNNDTWETNDPELYGGVKLEKTPLGTVGTTFTCGPDFDGKYTYEGKDRISGYEYFKCFPNIELSYIKRNSISLGFSLDDVEIDPNTKNTGKTFPLTPFHENLKDPVGKDAPILPMDAITKFVPDDSESYEVTYEASIEVKFNKKIITLENPTITVTQDVVQDLSSINFGAQLQSLLGFCNFSYPYEYNVSVDQLSEGYSSNYPHTTVTYLEGEKRDNYDIDRGETPSERTDGTPLEKGDVWYDPNTDVRRYYQINSFVEDVKILERGTIYAVPERPQDFGNLLKGDESLMKGLDNLLGDSQEAINIYLENSNADQVVELLDGQDSFTTSYEETKKNDTARRRYNITTVAENPNSTGYGLTVDIVVNKKGRVMKAEVNKKGLYYTDGEIVLLEGGDCKLQVEVNDDEFWTEEFVSRYERPPNYWNNDISNQS